MRQVCTIEKWRRDRAPGLEEGEDGGMVGRDPRQMTQAELQTLGHEPMSPLAALRLRCLDCCGNQPSEVRKCVSVTCASWPFRMEWNPWRAPKSEAQLKAARERGKKLAEARRLQACDAETAVPVHAAAPEDIDV
jgi:hypothetical protein